MALPGILDLGPPVERTDGGRLAAARYANVEASGNQPSGNSARLTPPARPNANGIATVGGLNDLTNRDAFGNPITNNSNGLPNAQVANFQATQTNEIENQIRHSGDTNFHNEVSGQIRTAVDWVTLQMRARRQPPPDDDDPQPEEKFHMPFLLGTAAVAKALDNSNHRRHRRPRRRIRDRIKERFKEHKVVKEKKKERKLTEEHKRAQERAKEARRKAEEARREHERTLRDDTSKPGQRKRREPEPEHKIAQGNDREAAEVAERNAAREAEQRLARETEQRLAREASERAARIAQRETVAAERVGAELRASTRRVADLSRDLARFRQESLIRGPLRGAGGLLLPGAAAAIVILSTRPAGEKPEETTQRMAKGFNNWNFSPAVQKAAEEQGFGAGAKQYALEMAQGFKGAIDFIKFWKDHPQEAYARIGEEGRKTVGVGNAVVDEVRQHPESLRVFAEGTSAIVGAVAADPKLAGTVGDLVAQGPNATMSPAAAIEAARNAQNNATLMGGVTQVAPITSNFYRTLRTDQTPKLGPRMPEEPNGTDVRQHIFSAAHPEDPHPTTGS